MQVLTWASYKSIVIANLNLPYRANLNADGGYFITAPDVNGITWDITLPGMVPDPAGSDTPVTNPDLTDFVTNYLAGANKSSVAWDMQGYALVASVKPVDGCHIDSRFGIYGVVSQAVPGSNVFVFTNPLPSVVLQGIRFDAKGTEAGDSLSLVEVGYYIPETTTWVQVEWYGDSLYFSGGDYVETDESSLRSNPLPQGMSIRFTYTQANPETTATPKIALWFKFLRPYGT